MNLPYYSDFIIPFGNMLFPFHSWLTASRTVHCTVLLYTEYKNSRQNIKILFWKYVVDIRSEALLNLFGEYKNGKLIKGFGGMMQLFLFIFTFIPSSCIQYIHPSPFAEAPLHLCIAGQGQWEKPSWGAEPRIELEPALRRTTHWATPHPTELLRTLLIYAASYWAMQNPTELCRTLTELRCSIL
jgi:hypothetical protein